MEFFFIEPIFRRDVSATAVRPPPGGDVWQTRQATAHGKNLVRLLGKIGPRGECFSWMYCVLLSLANYGDMARVQTVGAQHAVPVLEYWLARSPGLGRRLAQTRGLF